VAIRLKNGKRIAITNSCAANALGLVNPEHFSYGNAESAKKAIQPLADYIGVSVEETATQILERASEKIAPIIQDLAEKYRLEKDQMSLVGVGGGAAALIIYFANKLGLRYSIPENAEVISSIGVALSMVRDVVERIIPNVGPADIRNIKAEVIEKAVESGASPDTIEVHIEIDPQTSKVTAIALGSTEVKTVDLLSECGDDEALRLAAADMKVAEDKTSLVCKTPSFRVYSTDKNGMTPLRILDKKGFIKVQRNDGKAVETTAAGYVPVVTRLWEDQAVYKSDAILRPDYYLCAGNRVMDFAGTGDLKQILMLMDIEMQTVSEDSSVLVIGAKNML